MRLVTDLQERLVFGSSWDGDRCEVESDRQRMSVTSVDKSVYSTCRDDLLILRGDFWGGTHSSAFR